jgi:broad specificity phosphatase PhoE
MSRLPGRTVAVTHGSLARVIVTAIVLGADPALHRRLWLDNGRLVLLRWYEGRPRLLGFNAAMVEPS